MNTIINFDNFEQYVGQEVSVEIGCSRGGMCYPDRNALVGMNKGTYYFKSLDEGDVYYWHWHIEDEDCDIIVFQPKTTQP